MKKNDLKVAVGIGMIFLGCIFLVDSFNLVNINIPKGWWALIILVPCIIGLVKRKGNRTLCIIGTAASAGIIFSGYLGNVSAPTLVIAIVIILVGIKAIWPNFFKEKLSYKEPGSHEERHDNYQDETDNEKVNLDKNAYAYRNDEMGNKTGSCNDIYAIFSGKDLKMDGSCDDKLNLTAVFGGIDVDFRHIEISHDITLNCDAVFGGITVYAPENVKIKQNVSSIFGGVENHARTPENIDEYTPTLFINGACIFGGIEIK